MNELQLELAKSRAIREETNEIAKRVVGIIKQLQCSICGGSGVVYYPNGEDDYNSEPCICNE